MTITPETIIQLFLGCLLGIVGWNIRQILNKVDSLEAGQRRNADRLVRIETRLGIEAENGYDA